MARSGAGVEGAMSRNTDWRDDVSDEHHAEQAQRAREEAEADARWARSEAAWSHTSRGRAMDLRAPVAGDIDIAEISRSLAHQCRYAGCVLRFYSVAEHSVLIARWLAKAYGDRQHALAGLLHDAAEAYTGDITYPMQALLWSVSADAEATYKAAQHRLDALIAARAGVPMRLLHDPRVKEADQRILNDEREALLSPGPRRWPVQDMGPLGVELEGWDPKLAAWEWSDAYVQLGGAL